MDTSLSIEAMLNKPPALLGVLQVIRRAQRASHYAHDWAFEQHDMNIDEVALAALLHDLPEILLWCFAPKLIEIRDRRRATSRCAAPLQSRCLESDCLICNWPCAPYGTCPNYSTPCSTMPMPSHRVCRT